MCESSIVRDAKGRSPKSKSLNTSREPTKKRKLCDIQTKNVVANEENHGPNEDETPLSLHSGLFNRSFDTSSDYDGPLSPLRTPQFSFALDQPAFFGSRHTYDQDRDLVVDDSIPSLWPTISPSGGSLFSPSFSPLVGKRKREDFLFLESKKIQSGGSVSPSPMLESLPLMDSNPMTDAAKEQPLRLVNCSLAWGTQFNLMS
jgi:hypothetical protein